MYLIPQIYEKTSQSKSLQKLKDSEIEWKIENDYSDDNFHSVYKLRKFQQEKVLEIILDNKITTLQIYLKKTINHLVINPMQTFYWHKYNQKKYNQVEFHLSEESKKYFIFKISYSILFYIIIFMGIFETFRNRYKLKFHLLVFFLVLYLIFMLGWIGNSRYFMPSVIFLSIFFGQGVHFFINLKNKKIHNPI